MTLCTSTAGNIYTHVQYHTSNAYCMHTNFRRMYVLQVPCGWGFSFLAKRPKFYFTWRFCELRVCDTIVAITQQLDVHISSDVSCCCCFEKHSWHYQVLYIDMSTVYLCRCAIYSCIHKQVMIGRRHSEGDMLQREWKPETGNTLTWYVLHVPITRNKIRNTLTL